MGIFITQKEMNNMATKDKGSTAWAAREKVATTVAGWTIGRESARREAARAKALKEAARERAVEREAVRAVAVQPRGVGSVEGPIIRTSVERTQM